MTETIKTRIMFVDDDPMLLASTRRQLMRKMPSCKLVFFERASDALEDIVTTRPDVVLSDVRMPEIDGAEFLERVAAQRPTTIRLAWTGQSDADQLIRVFETAHKVFSKPCPTEQLIAMITSIADFSIQQQATNATGGEPGIDLESLQDRLSCFEEITIAPSTRAEMQ